jgi:hypothetical protein
VSGLVDDMDLNLLNLRIEMYSCFDRFNSMTILYVGFSSGSRLALLSLSIVIRLLLFTAENEMTSHELCL